MVVRKKKDSYKRVSHYLLHLLFISNFKYQYVDARFDRSATCC